MDKDKENMEIKVSVPVGMVIDSYKLDGNDLVVSLKTKDEKTFDDIMEWASTNREIDVEIVNIAEKKLNVYLPDYNKVIAYCRLLLIAKYFNEDWEYTVDINGYIENSFAIRKDTNGEYSAVFLRGCSPKVGMVLFNDEEKCYEAINIMGDDLKYLF